MKNTNYTINFNALNVKCNADNMGEEDRLHKQENSGSQHNENKEKNLILYNDEVNDFNYVIESLIEICNHDNVQAEQCAYLTHYNGKCEVKKGPYQDLKVMKDGLFERGLQAEIY
ncbi:MAG: ATP-dependent Clp protease adaptor ClpS [Bacteroidota bacterium]